MISDTAKSFLNQGTARTVGARWACAFKKLRLL
jgi:hypothetical protein